MSPRTMLEMLGGGILAGLLIWQVLEAEGLRADVANHKATIAARERDLQASETSEKSCQAALVRSSAATVALNQATESIQGSVDQALLAASGRDHQTAQDVARLLAVTSTRDRDCETALAFGQAAWEEGQ